MERRAVSELYQWRAKATKGDIDLGEVTSVDEVIMNDGRCKLAHWCSYKIVIFGAFEVKMKKFFSFYQFCYNLESTTLRTLQYLKRWAMPAGCCDEH